MSDELIADLTERARSSEQSNAELRAEVARLRWENDLLRGRHKDPFTCRPRPVLVACEGCHPLVEWLEAERTAACSLFVVLVSDGAQARKQVDRLRLRCDELTAALRPFADRTAGLEHWAAAERLLSEVK